MANETVIERLVFQLGANLTEFNSKISQAQAKLKGLGKKTAQIGAGLSIGVTAPIIGIGAVALKASIDMETAFTGMRKTIDATGEELAEMKDGIIDMSEEIPVAANELFGIAEAAGQLGIEKDSILDFTRVIADLSVTSNLTSESAALMLAKFANVTQLSVEDYERLGSTISALGNSSETTERDIVSMASRLAGAGQTIGLTQAEIISFSAALSSVGIEAEAGGSAFSKVMKDISKEIGSGSEKLEEFARISGVSVDEFENAWSENAATAILSFTEGLARVQVEGENVNSVLDDLGFEGIRVSDTLLKAAAAGDSFREKLDLGNTAWKENIALTKEAELRYGTTESKLKILKNTTENAASSIGDVMKPVLDEIVTAIKPVIKWFGELDDSTKGWMIGIGLLVAGIGPLLIAAGFVANAIGLLVAGIGPLLIAAGFVATAIGAIGVPIALVIGGIALLTAGFIAFGSDIKGIFGASVDWVIDKIDSIIDAVKIALSWLGDLISKISSIGAGVIGGAVGSVINTASDFFSGGSSTTTTTTDNRETNVFINEKLSRSDLGGLAVGLDTQLARG